MSDDPVKFERPTRNEVRLFRMILEMSGAHNELARAVAIGATFLPAEKKIAIDKSVSSALEKMEILASSAKELAIAWEKIFDA